MKDFLKKLIFLTPLVICMLVPQALAHQPRITENTITNIVEPEISKAYYAQLSEGPHTYIIQATGSLQLYVNILVPDIPGASKDVTATIFQNGDFANPIATLGGSNTQWKYFFEPFGYDAYWQGTEYRAKVGSGVYQIQVSSPLHNSKYSLAVGELENFDFRETMNALTLIPKLKRDFFNTSPMNFVFSPFGWGLIVMLYLCSLVFVILLRLFLRKLPRQIFGTKVRNIGKLDRGMRLTLSVVLLLFAMATSWSPVLIFASGFCFFEAVLGWCPFYMMLGRDSCPMGK